MSLRDDIDALIEDFDGWQEYSAENRLKTADAILALVRAHMTSDEAVERARPWCDTCGKDVIDVLCPTCAKWWDDNPLPSRDIPEGWRTDEPVKGIRVLGGRWEPTEGIWTVGVIKTPLAYPFTHWMPLPAPPAPETPE